MHRHRERLVDALLLFLALNAPKILFGLPRTPWLAQLSVFVAFALVVSPPPALGVWARFLRLLSGYLISVIAGIAGFHYYFELPAQHLCFAPSWLALTAAVRLPLRRWTETAAAWARERRLDVLMGDAVLVLLFAWLAARLSQSPGASVWLGVLPAAGWFALHMKWRWHDPKYGAPVWPATTLAAAWGLAWLLMTGGSNVKVALTFTFWLALALILYRCAVRRWAATPEAGFAEVIRWIGLSALIALLFHPFVRPGVHGSGDALYYATFLTDALEQFRAGVFPVFVGQSEYQFNGSVIPIRVAPGFQYFAGLLDLLTGRTLSSLAVQNLVILVTAFAAGGAAYASLRALALPPMVAWILAVLYLTCPGVMGLAFNSDLYMSWLTVPLVPVVFYLGLQTFANRGPWLFAALGLTLGATWWCHPPIAVWLTAAQVMLQVARLVWARPSPSVLWRELLAGAAAIGGTACYPLVSVLLYPVDPQAGASGGFVVPPNHILQQLLETFPAAWFPLSDLARRLTDFQIGYGLLAATFIISFSAWRSARPELRVLLVVATGLLLLLLPVPGLNLALWRLVPDAVRAATNIWPMQRLYLVLAGVCIGLIAWTWIKAPGDAAMQRHQRFLLLCALGWSLAEALKFMHGSWATVTPRSAAPERLAPENITLTRYSYGLFAAKPGSFTHGVTDPALENRLLDADQHTVVAANYDAAAREAHSAVTYRFRVVEGHIETEPRVTLHPGRRYLATLKAPVELQGTLVLEGTRLQRVYGLPEYGEARSFGLTPGRNPFFPVHTSGSETERVRVLFESGVAVDLAALAARITLVITEYSSEKLPVRVLSWLPYSAAVTSPTAAWLETPRMYQASWRATVDGRPTEVRRSPEGLAIVPVPAGDSEVVLHYSAPIGLQVAFWISLAAIMTGTSLALIRAERALRISSAATAQHPQATAL